MDVDYFWIGIAGGCAVFGWLIAATVFSRKKKRILAERDRLAEQRDISGRELSLLNERFTALGIQLKATATALDAEREKSVSLATRLAVMQERSEALSEALSVQKVEMSDLQKTLTKDFENLANRILEEKSKSFREQNRESLDQLLVPLGEKISSFRERVEQSREADIKDRASLVEHLKSLKALNQQMSVDAQNLTSALKGEVKTQGNWGEFVLEKVLEKSGLVAGREYEVQVNLKDESGRRFQPDVVINLPDEKHLIVDSKVSLVAYEQYSKAENKEQESVAMKAHLESLRSHVASLSAKGYESLQGIHSPDFTLMFIPIEPAFSAAIVADDSLFDFAFSRNVVMVTPSTLLVTLRTISNIWRQEKQARNAYEIARKSGDLYDKFVGFCEDVEEIGRRIGKSQEAYSGAMNKLSTGNGNLVRRVEQLKTLGAQAKKSLPRSLLGDDDSD